MTRSLDELKLAGPNNLASTIGPDLRLVPLLPIVHVLDFLEGLTQTLPLELLDDCCSVE